MVYGFQLETFLWVGLLAKMRNDTFKRINKADKLLKIAKKGDIVIVANYTEHLRKVMHELDTKGVIVIPSLHIRDLVSDRQEMLKKLSPITIFEIKRLYMDKGVHKVPDLGTGKVVAKIGDEHQGRDKYLREPGGLLRATMPVTFEEFIPDAKSLRIITIDDNKENWFIVDYIEPKYPCEEYSKNSWIKNIQCDFVTYSYKDRYKAPFRDIDAIISDVCTMKAELNHNYLAFDYVQNSERTAFLEVNDMPGMPEDSKELKEKAIDYFLELVNQLENNKEDM